MTPINMQAIWARPISVCPSRYGQKPQPSKKDYLGDPLPEGYRSWFCGICQAGCNFEAMNQCSRRMDSSAECGFDQDKPESNGGVFAFMVLDE